MLRKFSKSATDINLEHLSFKSKDLERLKQQRIISSELSLCNYRKLCVLCNKQITDDCHFFVHRKITYKICKACGHIQTQRMPPKGYPFTIMKSGFEDIYISESIDQYNSRRDRIYAPKLSWVLECLESALSIDLSAAISKQWVEIGCGAGYFLNELQRRGFKRILGVDVNEKLIDMANKFCGENFARPITSFKKLLSGQNPDVVVAFFVLEHLEGENVSDFWQSLKEVASGTVFVFSVPCFGISTIFETSFNNFAARQLDSVIHTQLFTEDSIQFQLKENGFEIVAEWLFGQDSQDLFGTMLQKSDGMLPEEFGIPAKLSTIIDPIQKIIDTHRLCDSRHIICVKT